MNAQTSSETQALNSVNKTAYRNYAAPQVSETFDRVREFYKLNHTHQTHEFVKAKKADYLSFSRQKMTPWAALDYLNTLVDDSDPDIALPQIDHLVQTAEAMRRDGQPDWMVLTGFVHDLGKVLCLFGEPQWAVVGDTFPTGCAYSPKIVYSEFFPLNPDSQQPELQTQHGVYAPHCGLNAVHMSWGHDEYLYHLLREHLPLEALYMIRYHSFYSWHRQGDYDHLCNAQDRAMLPWVQRFNPYDLYSKNPERPKLADVKPYYEDLMAKYLPATLQF
ncbi:MAG: inositol oxygenase [Brachymonas sp.]|nr:inositol oxygenase [Brachymonas sp.]